MKQMKNHNFYDNCMLCPRTCGAQRSKGKTGICGVTETLKVARAALHFWEEPCISGTKGSGAVFFSGCALHCVFCQNESIAQGTAGKEITPERLVEIFLELQEQGANNINLVTPGQYVPHIIRAVEQARRQGLAVPIVYNTGSYENVDTIKALEGIVDIYLPDFKYMDPFLAAKYSHAPDYPQTAKAAIAEMVRQQPRPVFAWEEKRGEDVPKEACEGAVMKRGVIVRQLLLPGCLKDARNIVRYLYETYQNKIYVSLMSQYTPLEHVRDYPELAHRVSRRNPAGCGAAGAAAAGPGTGGGPLHRHHTGPAGGGPFRHAGHAGGKKPAAGRVPGAAGCLHQRWAGSFRGEHRPTDAAQALLLCALRTGRCSAETPEPEGGSHPAARCTGGCPARSAAAAGAPGVELRVSLFRGIKMWYTIS